MLISLFISIFWTAVVALIFYSVIEPGRTIKKGKSVVFIFFTAFLVRLICAAVYPGYETDMNCFDVWSNMIFRDGFAEFYTSNTFTDYPPGYMYILYFLGFIKNLFGTDKNTAYILLKLPAVICDIASAAVIYKLFEKNNTNIVSVILTSFFLFNPAVIINSSVWGQTDSVYTLFVLLMLYFAYEKKLEKSYFLFAAAIFIKPQALFYTPVLIFAAIEQIFLKDFSPKKLIKHIICSVSAVLMIVILTLPFGIEAVINQYKNTIASYSFASVNAYNLWTALGLNWHELNPFLSAVGFLLIAVIVIFSAAIFFSKKPRNRYFYTAAFIGFSTFMLSVKMHERYAYASIALMLCAFAQSKKKEELFLFTGFSVIQFLNAAHVLFYYNPETYYSSGYEKTAVIISISAVIVLLCLWLYTKKTYLHLSKISVQESAKVLSKITKIDIISISIITLIYSVIAFYNLGDFNAPQSFSAVSHDTALSIDLGSGRNISEIKLYLGSRELSDSRKLRIKISDESGEPVYDNNMEDGSVFCWTELSDIGVKGRYIEFSSDDTVYIMETGIYDDSKLLRPISFPSQLFDEQNCIPSNVNYKNGTYFDEIYHARTAYEFLHEQSVYEWTHPPLGKIFISAGINLFGMTPFGWRIAGTLFGIAMIPVLYVFSKKLFGLTWLSNCATLIFSFDFMHFTQTRIATIDVYVTFFIMLMYLFMYKYYTINFYNAPLKKTFVPLAFSGISMGAAIACKWTGIYAGAGLAVIFFITIWQRYRENNPQFRKKTLKTVLFCFLVFIIVPVAIYAFSYIPFMRCNHTGLAGIIQNQTDMFTYHSKTVVSSEHPFSSPWYQWPIDARPIWYYSGENGTLSENISSFGNPFVWWVGIFVFFYCIYDFIKNKDKNALYLIIGYLAQLIPWMFVTRTTFIYHYFPDVPFVVLMIAHTIHKLYQKDKRYKKYAIIYTALCIVVFIAFYPVLSGLPVNGDYVRNFLRWLPSWQLIG